MEVPSGRAWGPHARSMRERWSRIIREREARWGAEGTQTNRKPMLLFRLPGEFLLRFAERRFLALLFQDPPRRTRPASINGSPVSVYSAKGPHEVSRSCVRHRLPGRAASSLRLEKLEKRVAARKAAARKAAEENAAQERRLRESCRLPGERAGERCVMKVSGVSVPMRWIPAGSVRMGSPVGEACRADDETRWTARISHGFWMGETEVTQELWESVTGNNPSRFFDCGPACPVERVSREMIAGRGGFLEKVNGKVSGGRFRLPREAEWEYAARAGTTGPFGISCPGYNGSNCLVEVSCLNRIGWYDQNSGGKTHPVGQKQGNAWGLHDMHGNVWEWCQDRDGDYPEGTRTDYEGSSVRDVRVLRGGSWNNYARDLRSAYRFGVRPGSRSKAVGFRLVWVPSAPQGSHH